MNLHFQTKMKMSKVHDNSQDRQWICIRIQGVWNLTWPIRNNDTGRESAKTILELFCSIWDHFPRPGAFLIRLAQDPLSDSCRTFTYLFHKYQWVHWAMHVHGNLYTQRTCQTNLPSEARHHDLGQWPQFIENSGEIVEPDGVTNCSGWRRQETEPFSCFARDTFVNQISLAAVKKKIQRMRRISASGTNLRPTRLQNQKRNRKCTFSPKHTFSLGEDRARNERISFNFFSVQTEMKHDIILVVHLEENRMGALLHLERHTSE